MFSRHHGLVGLPAATFALARINCSGLHPSLCYTRGGTHKHDKGSPRECLLEWLEDRNISRGLGNET
ncbi:hypothetical protein TorRG33x02_129520 [Trema orientale]|uniref:Uncharacterized protein n=1 Tax=Trema orientale TaxID=63057 RepID=A0A2P5F0U1_TREOI|nr:hypothetical protein TorRG33x02_129520 [Trema orientale]